MICAHLVVRARACVFSFTAFFVSSAVHLSLIICIICEAVCSNVLRCAHLLFVFFRASRLRTELVYIFIMLSSRIWLDHSLFLFAFVIILYLSWPSDALVPPSHAHIPYLDKSFSTDKTMQTHSRTHTETSPLVLLVFNVWIVVGIHISVWHRQMRAKVPCAVSNSHGQWTWNFSDKLLNVEHFMFITLNLNVVSVVFVVDSNPLILWYNWNANVLIQCARIMPFPNSSCGTARNVIPVILKLNEHGRICR